MSDVTPPPIEFARMFLPVYQWFVPRLNHLVDGGAIPSSWFRTAALNALVGGSSESQHLFAFAADFAYRGELSPLVLREEARRIGLIAVAEKDHLHVQIFPAGTLRAAGLFETREA